LFDVLLKGGTIVDGTGASAYPADIGVFGDRIEAMGRFDAASAEVTVDASGQIVTPGGKFFALDTAPESVPIRIFSFCI